jgi:hypothetical protein
MRRARALLASATAILSAAVALSTVITPGVGGRADAATATDFLPGLIISDATFFDSATMTTADVQAFLEHKEGSCRAGSICLESYNETVAAHSADTYCTTFGGGTMSGAQIIAGVATACGINPQVILATLEKEWSLVSSSGPSSSAYRTAMGYGCPDTAACNSLYYGFANQVYNAARQFRIYAANPKNFNYRAGQTAYIPYSTQASCPGGAPAGSTVIIQNGATAALYNYTPYQPNAAALANLYGTGDACSSYGNRNFWRIFSDWFGSPLAGLNLVRTQTNATVYLIAGSSKYPVASLTELGALSPLGEVGYVSGAYLGTFVTQQVAGRVVRGPDGSMFFIDSGIKLPFPSCGLVADYGGSCDSSGYVQLTDAQLASFATGPAVGPLMGLASGQRFWVYGGVKHQILDASAQSAAGLPSSMNVLGPSALDNLPYGAPVVDDGVFAQVAGGSSYVLISGGKRYEVDASVLPLLGLPSGAGGSLEAGSVAQLPDGGAFRGVFQVPGSAQVRVVASGGSVVWSGSAGGAALGAVPVPQSFADRYPARVTVGASAAVMSPASATVYLVMPSQILPVGAWDSLVALSAGKTPVISTVPEVVLAGLPRGPVALTAGTLARSPDNATVYLINGVTNKIPFSSFAFPTELGVTQFSYTSRDRLDAYPTSSQLLQFGVTCGGAEYVTAGGQIHAVPSSKTALYPFSYVPLDQYTCALLTKGADAGSFIRTPNGSIYELSGGKKLPITSMARYEQLNNGAGYLDVAAGFAAAISTGPNA